MAVAQLSCQKLEEQHSERPPVNGLTVQAQELLPAQDTGKLPGQMQFRHSESRKPFPPGAPPPWCVRPVQ